MGPIYGMVLYVLKVHFLSLLGPTINFRICHPRSAFGNKAGHLVVLRRADHAVARSQHGFAAVCDVLSATLSARSRRQAPDDRARPSRSADGIARGLSGERIERTEPAHRRTDVARPSQPRMLQLRFFRMTA